MTGIFTRIDEIAKIAYSSRNVVEGTYSLSDMQLQYNGCFVECGVGAGAQLAAMQLAIGGGPTKQQIWAFDSFEGIPLAGIYDEQQPGIGKPQHDTAAPIQERLVSSGITSHSVENVKENLIKLGLPIDNIHFIKGWFQGTLPVTAVPPISLLRLDGDLYESTLVCLQYLFPKVISGGVVIIDDYALSGCRKAVKYYFKTLPKMIDIEKTEDVHVVMFFKK